MAIMKRVLVATSNQGKIRDLVGAAAAHGIEIATLPAFASLPSVVEDGVTFEANANKKAEYYSQYSDGELVIADDSGLEVDALQGAPGVRSARYAADEHSPDEESGNSDDEANNDRLLRELHEVPNEYRTGTLRVRYRRRTQRPHAGDVSRQGRGHCPAHSPRLGWVWVRSAVLLPADREDLCRTDGRGKSEIQPPGRGLPAISGSGPTTSTTCILTTLRDDRHHRRGHLLRYSEQAFESDLVFLRIQSKLLSFLTYAVCELDNARFASYAHES